MLLRGRWPHPYLGPAVSSGEEMWEGSCNGLGLQEAAFMHCSMSEARWLDCVLHVQHGSYVHATASPTCAARRALHSRHTAGLLRCCVWCRGGRGPLLDLAAHAHWVWRATFHPAYDNLLLSCSSDSTCALWHINLAATTAQKAGAAAPTASRGTAGGTASKAVVAVAADGRAGAAGAAAAKPQPTGRGGPPAMRLQQSSAQDSIYAVAWSTAVDPWVYMSLCIDGRLALHKVPNSTKYKLLAGS